MSQENLLEYIKLHIDENDVFTSRTLPDMPDLPDTFYLGATDSFYYTGIVDDKPADELLEAFRTYLVEQNAEARQNLEDLLNSCNLTAIHKDFLNSFDLSEYNHQIFNIAQNFFYNAEKRNTLKFALMLFAYEGLLNIKESDPVLWEDILTVARCEEFTYFFIVAGHQELAELQEELWDIAYCTKNWGKIYALGEVVITNREQQLWCIECALDVDVEFPLLSIKILDECNLLSVLEQNSITYPLYRGSLLLLINFTMLLTQFTKAELEENYNLASINLPALLDRLFYHAGKHAFQPEQIINLSMLSSNLNTLAEEEAYTYLSANQYHNYIAVCDSIIFSKDWTKTVQQQLFNTDGTINYTILDLGTRLNIDVWDRVFDYYCNNYTESKVFSYLFQTDNEDKIKKLLAEITQHLVYYFSEPTALAAPMIYLSHAPGEGISLINGLLNIKMQYPILIAASIIINWPTEYITESIYNNLNEARKYVDTDDAIQLLDYLIYQYQLHKEEHPDTEKSTLN